MAEEIVVERRHGSRTPLRIILLVLIALSGLWLYRLYEDPTWSKIGSFVLGYFLGSFVMDWINQRSSRGVFGFLRVAGPPRPTGAGTGSEVR